jgi:RNA polymerase sigma-70 factor (ECF subfamily)
LNESLAARAKAGDSQAVQALVREYYPRIKGLCRAILRHDQDAEDAAQEVFVRMQEKLALYDASRPFAPWLLQLAHHAALNHARKKRIPLLDEPPEVEDDRSPVKVLSEREDVAAVRRAIDRLPWLDRSILSYAADLGLSKGEIAEVTGLSPNAVRIRFHRALRKLRKELS